MENSSIRQEVHDMIDEAADQDVPHILAIFEGLFKKPKALVDNKGFMTIWQDQIEIARREPDDNDSWAAKRSIFERSEKIYKELTNS